MAEGAGGVLLLAGVLGSGLCSGLSSAAEQIAPAPSLGLEYRFKSADSAASLHFFAGHRISSEHRGDAQASHVKLIALDGTGGNTVLSVGGLALTSSLPLEADAAREEMGIGTRILIGLGIAVGVAAIATHEAEEEIDEAIEGETRRRTENEVSSPPPNQGPLCGTPLGGSCP